MKTPTRASDLTLHTKILWIAVGLIVVSVLVMIIRQATSTTVDQYWEKTSITFE